MATTALFPSQSLSSVGSASGALALFEEHDTQLKTYALRKLHAIVDEQWSEISTALVKLEALSEDESFPERELAAAVASKCYYHLEEYDDALRLAVAAGAHFNVEERSQYVDTMVSRCIDMYSKLQVHNAIKSDKKRIDPRLEDIVNRMFDRCFSDGEYKQALGVALESRRIDMVEKSISQSGEHKEMMLRYTLGILYDVVERREFRQQVLKVLAELFRESGSKDYIGLCRTLEFLGDSVGVSESLQHLLLAPETDEHYLLALQVAFDIYEHNDQHFIVAVIDKLPAFPESFDAKDLDATKNVDLPEHAAEGFWKRLHYVRTILDGEVPLMMRLDFLARTNRADLLLLGKIKDQTEIRPNSVLRNAVVVSHALMHAGTTKDLFLRDNLDWLGKASHWARFTATASLGVIHQGHLTESMNVLAPYLPQPSRPSTQQFSEGGALYALGLIHANMGQVGGGETINYLRDALQNTQSEPVRHGSCLGIGLAAMATGQDHLYAQLREIMFDDAAVAGEAAALGIGLLLCGRGAGWTSDITGDSAVTEMLNYARDTQHEKIIRGIAMALAFTVYGQEEGADVLIEQMLRDKDPILRYGGAYAIGMAYVSTSSNSAIGKLLHVAVSDVSDDVRRAAVTVLGFVMCNRPRHVPRVVALLAESYNPHVRYGAAMAIGVACAGSGMPEAVDLVQPLVNDATDFVRQGALMSLGMILQQESEGRNKKVKEVRENFLSVVGDRMKPLMTKVGAILATGIVDAGGRNCTISLRSPSGFTKMSSVVGMAVSLQYWYWFPYLCFMGIAFDPTPMVAVTKDIKMPKNFRAICRAKPSKFAYPEPMKAKSDEKKEEVVKVELSVKARRKKRAAGTPRAASGTTGAAAEKMDVDEPGEKSASSTAPGGTAAEASKDDSTAKPPAEAAAAGEEGEKAAGEKDAGGKAKPAPEPTEFFLENPCRVTPAQRAFVSFDLTGASRFVPVVPDTGLLSSVIVLKDRSPDEETEYADFRSPDEYHDDGEPKPPEDFEWTPPS